MLSEDLGPYRLEDLLGSGGMGEVYRAYDRRLDRWVAVKIVRSDASQGLRARERFRREARSAARLSHSSIVQIHDIIEREDEGDCIVMELVEGESLAEILSRGPLAHDRAVRLARRIAEGLAVAHAKGIVHRDLKSENVMIAADDRPKILDFGLAKRLQRTPDELSLSIDGRVVGTGHAMSPEQAQGLPVDPRSDLFALGSLLYEMLTGLSPFRRTTLAETLTWVCMHRQVPLKELVPELPVELSNLTDRLLEKAPQDRPGSASEVALTLRRLEPEMSGSRSASMDPASAPTLVDLPRSSAGGAPAWESTPTVSKGSERPSTTWIPGRRWLPGIGLAVLVGIAAVAGGWYFLAPSPPTLVVVAVPEPEVTTSSELQEPALLAASVRVALLQGLLGLRSVSPLSPDQVDAVQGSSEGVAGTLARTLAADELVTAHLTCRQLTCRATLHRAGADGRLLGTQSCDILTDDLLLASSTLIERVQRLYEDHPVRPGVATLNIEEADYEAFLRLREEFLSRTGDVSLVELLDRSEGLRRRAPEFLPIYILEANIARTRFLSSRDSSDLQRALDAIERARDLAPEGSQPLIALADVALDSDRLDLAEGAVEELERLSPGDPMTVSRRAAVLERRGREQEALELLRHSVRRRPSVKNLFDLANMEIRLGHAEEARSHLEDLLRLHPDNFGAGKLLAQTELIYGDPQRAAELYRELVEKSPELGLYSNLGIAQLLLKRYQEAAESFERALELAPRSPFAQLNLADALLLVGREAEAREQYRKVLETIDTDPAGNWQYPIMQAQVLAHLGEDRRAASLAQQALQAAPDNSQIAYQAAVVFAVVGDTASALASVERALALGYEDRWFGFPWFDRLRRHPDFQSLFGRTLPETGWRRRLLGTKVAPAVAPP